MFDRIQRATQDSACDRALQEIASGSSESLSVIYRVYGKMILSLAYQILHNEQDAQDVLQDVLVSVAQNAKSYQGSTNPRAWVMAIARNKALDLSRKKAFEVPGEWSENDIRGATYPDPAVNALLSDALQTLSDEERTMIHLKIYVGLSHTEIASVLQLPKSASEKRYQRAIAKLRDYFEKGTTI